MTALEVAHELAARQKEHHAEIKNFLTEERERVDRLAQRFEDTLLFGGASPSHRQPTERALGGLPIANIKPTVGHWQSKEQRFAWDRYLLTADRRDFEASLQVGLEPAGGYLVNPVISQSINSRAFEKSPMRQICRLVPLETGDEFREPITWRLPGAQWRGETETRTTTERPDLKEASAPLNEIDANIETTQKLLDTAAYDIADWVEQGIAESFAITDNATFVSGDGDKKPRGFLTYPNSTDPDSTRDFGVLQYHVTGVNGAFAAAPNALDVFDEAVASLKAAYRPNAVWLASRATWGRVRRLRDADGHSLWQPSMQAGQPDRLMGYPILEAEDMPDSTATDALAIAFGNFQRGYTIIDGKGMTLLRDPFTAKGFVKFFATRRTGGGVWNSEAIKLIKFGQS